MAFSTTPLLSPYQYLKVKYLVQELTEIKNANTLPVYGIFNIGSRLKIKSR